MAAWGLQCLSFVARLNLSSSISAHSESWVSRSGLEIDAAVQAVTTEALRFDSLLAMMAGGLAYRFTKAASLSCLSGVFSPALALTGEVFTYESVHRAFGQNQNSFSEGFRSSFLTFGVLKSFSHIFKSQNIFLRHLSQDVGVVLSEEAAFWSGFGLSPSGSIFQRLLHAESSNLCLGIGMYCGHLFTGGIFQICENVLERSIQIHSSMQRNPPASFQFLESVRAEGGSFTSLLSVREKNFIQQSLAKIDARAFRSGITAERLVQYRQVLQEMGIQRSFVEGRRRLIEILREDWIEKCEEIGIEVKRLKLSEYVALLRACRQSVPSWVDAFIVESETNAALEVISLTSYGCGSLDHDDALLRIEEENYLGLHFGGSTDQKLITEPLGLSPGSLSNSMDELRPQNSEWRRFFLPDELILQSAGRAHSHIAPGLHSYAEFCSLDEVRESRAEDAWVLHLSPEEKVPFHDSKFHPYLAIVHDIHIHWNYLNRFNPEVRMEKVSAFDHIKRERIHVNERRRTMFRDSDIAEILEGLWDHHEAQRTLENSR